MCLRCRTAVPLLSEGHPESKEFTQLECQRKGKQIAADAIKEKMLFSSEERRWTVGYVHRVYRPQF